MRCHGPTTVLQQHQDVYLSDLWLENVFLKSGPPSLQKSSTISRIAPLSDRPPEAQPALPALAQFSGAPPTLTMAQDPMSVPAPASPHGAGLPAPHSPALPGHGPPQARATYRAHVPAWPWLSPSPGRYSMSRAGAALVPLRLPCSLPAGWGSPAAPGIPSPREPPARTVPWHCPFWP